jgi:16S rRNA (guanine527-N7)-methyltransferase
LAAETDSADLVDRHVSRETLQRLERFHTVFLQWQKRINLVSPTTVSQFWRRHVADSLQLLAFAPDARCWVDLGSGGGFPGLVVAAARSDQAWFRTVLIESNGKKAAFLREAARVCGISAEIMAERLELALPRLSTPVDVVSARALAPLGQLIAWTEELLKTGTLGLYLKGKDATSEIAATQCPSFLRIKSFPGRIEPDSAIIAVWNPDRREEPKEPQVLAAAGFSVEKDRVS